MTAMSESSKISIIDVFLAYRRGEGEGDSFADELHKRLSGNPVISSDGKEYQLRVFYDRRTPGSDDWQRFWRVRLRTARALILICTPGAAQPRSASPDVLYEEINWWCKNRKNGPIVIDANGGGELVIPGPIRKHWPRAERLDWPSSDNLDRLIERIFSGVILSMVGIDDQELRRIRKRNRWLAGLAVMLVCALGMAIVARNNEKAAREAAELSEQAAISARKKEETARRIAEASDKEARRDARISVQSRDYLKTLFSRVTQARPEVARAMEAIVEKASDTAEGYLPDEAFLSAGMHDTIGGTFLSMGNLEKADEHLTKALQEYRQALGDDHPFTVGALANLGMLRVKQGRPQEGLPILEDLMRRRDRLFAYNQSGALSVINNLAVTFYELKEYEKATSLLIPALETDLQVLGRSDPLRLTMAETLAHIEFDQNKLTEAAQRVEATLKIRRDTFPEGHEDTIGALALLADIYEKQGETAKEQAVRKEIAELTGDDTGSPLVVELKQLTAAAEKLRGESKHAEATQVWENAIAAKRKKLGNSHREVVPLIHAFGVHLFQSKDYAKAESVIQEALAGWLQHFEPDDTVVLHTKLLLCQTLFALKKYPEAAALILEISPIFREALGDEAEQTTVLEHNLGGILANQGKYQEALPLLESAVAGHRKVFGLDAVNTLLAESKLASVYVELDQLSSADPLLHHVLLSLLQEKGYDHRNTQDVLQRLLEALLRQKKGTEICKLFEFVHTDRHLQLNELITLAATRHLAKNEYDIALAALEPLLERQRTLLRADSPMLGSCRLLVAELLLICETAEDPVKRKMTSQQASVLVQEAEENVRPPEGMKSAIMGRCGRVKGLALTARNEFADAEQTFRKAQELLALDLQNESSAIERQLIRKAVVELYQTWLKREPQNVVVRTKLEEAERDMKPNEPESK